MQYEELDLHSHTLKRPDTYVGSIVPTTSSEYVFDGQRITKKQIQHIPALMRIFIEALSNALDNIVRSRQYNVPCKTIKISVNSATGETSVWNDGLNIPIKIHDTTGIYIPDMLFGRLLTSSNYNDDEERQTSGRNGLGISLTNIFSKHFSVELVNTEDGKMYRQSWEQNMRVRHEPKLTTSKLKRGYTKVSWIPDFEYFKVDGYNDEYIALLTRYVYDSAMIASQDGVQMYFNDQKLPIRHFKDYVKLYLQPEDTMCAFTRDHSQCIITSSDSYGEISFVNGIFTSDGGVHVDAWSEPIFKHLVQKVISKLKCSKLTVKDIKTYFKVFVVSTLSNPTFSTQSKTKLVSPKQSIQVDVKETQSILSWAFVQDLKRTLDLKDKSLLKKVESKRTKRIDGYDPANKAGTRDSQKCTLILCEGLSAKTYAVMGIDQGIHTDDFKLKGRDWFGIMPLKGVLMNVRNYTSGAISENKEIVNLIQALGVQGGIDYSNNDAFKKLKYGRVLILTDADCFSPTTPVITKCKDIITVQPISSLYGKTYKDPVYVYDRNNWTLLKAIQRKRTTKKMLRVITNTGIFTCTTDHILMDKNGNQVRASCVRIGTELMSTTHIPTPVNATVIHPCKAWLMGVIFVCGQVRPDGVHIRTPKMYTDDIVFVFKRHYDVIPTVYRINNKYNTVFAPTTIQNVANTVLNADVGTLRAFYTGCVQSNASDVFEFDNECKVQQMYIVMKRLSYNIHLDVHAYNTKKYILYKTFFDSAPVVNCIQLFDPPEYVYDVETCSHTLNAGIGNVVQHNCDGIHIQGLILNMFHCLFPSLFQREGFLTCMNTPIMKVVQRNKITRFYSIADAQEYLKHNQPTQVKYYKGLGTSTDEDVRETFGKHITLYRADEKSDDTMDLLFNKQHAQYRKQWLASYDPNVHETMLGIVDTSLFLNHELIKFSIEDCKRSIPHIMDGLKESQRKILYACFKKKLTTPIKVAQLAGYVAEHTNYHHGEICLFDTIIKMAQDFIGSNNIPILQKEGQFGTRMQPNGSDAANARYIFTKLSTVTRTLFDPSDDCILPAQYDDGEMIEPLYYAPIIPMVLVNGANGIATGWSTNIPLFNPTQIVEWIQCFILQKELPELVPYYKNFKGRIEKETDAKYNTYGVYEQKEDEIYISEIPIGSWVDKYKEYLEELVDKKIIKQMKNYSKPDCIHFIVTCFKDQPVDESVLKLKSSILLGNMVLFDTDQRIRKYSTVHDILVDFCTHRLNMYKRRKEFIIKQLESAVCVLQNKIKCVQLYVSHTIDLTTDCVPQFKEHGIKEQNGSFDYLLNLPIRYFTQHKLDELLKTCENTQTQLETIKESSPSDLWLADLAELRL